jgi:hypothetical protein
MVIGLSESCAAAYFYSLIILSPIYLTIDDFKLKTHLSSDNSDDDGFFLIEPAHFNCFNRTYNNDDNDDDEL